GACRGRSGKRESGRDWFHGLNCATSPDPFPNRRTTARDLLDEPVSIEPRCFFITSPCRTRSTLLPPRYTGRGLSAASPLAPLDAVEQGGVAGDEDAPPDAALAVPGRRREGLSAGAAVQRPEDPFPVGPLPGRGPAEAAHLFPG